MSDLGYRGTKRLIDVTVASLALLAVAPILLLAAVLVRRQMGSPVLFRHRRAGRYGTSFEVLKLRTMRAPQPGEDPATSDLDRLTPLGARLRAWSIDELPQLVNVLTGDMSLVGPRPLPRHYLRRYTIDQRRRLKVTPGITGLAQVSGRNSLGWDERLGLDVYYVEHASLALDLKILVRTLLIVLRRVGIAAEGHATMPELQRSIDRVLAQAADPAGPTLRLQREPAAVWRWVGPAVVVSVRDDQAPQLIGGLGAVVWSLLEQPRTTEELLESMRPPVADAPRPNPSSARLAMDQLMTAGVLSVAS